MEANKKIRPIRPGVFPMENKQEFQAAMQAIPEHIPDPEDVPGYRPGKVEIVSGPIMWVCQKCRMRTNGIDVHGFLRDENGRASIPCPVCAPSIQARRMSRRVEGWIQTGVYTGMFSSIDNTPPESYYASMEDYPETGDRAALERVQQFIDGSIDSAYLYGDAGTGKTSLMFAALKELQAQKKQVLFLTAGEYFALVQENFNIHGQDNKIDEIVQNVEILFIDDLGVESPSKHTIKKWEELINARILKGKRTMITSNFSLAGLKEAWKLKEMEGTGFQPCTRVISRLKGAYVQIGFNCPDLREG
jgi:hypothetical protein